MPLVMMQRGCPRKLVPGEVRRYMQKGPLFGYMVACPACGFIEMHQHDKAGFVEVEEEGKISLRATKNAMRCMFCTRDITVAGDPVVIEAKLATAPAQ